MKKTKRSMIISLIILMQIIIIGMYGISYYNVNAETIMPDSISTADSIDLIKTKQQSFSATSIPVSYDLRSNNPFNLSSHGNLTINPENQVGGTCWNYAAMMSLQTFLAIKSNSSTYPLLSKAHLDYLASRYSGKKYGEGREIGNASWFSTVTSYFKNNDGPILNDKCYFTLYNGDRTNERVTLLGTDYYNNTDSTKTNICSIMDSIEPDYYVHEVTEFPKILVKAVTKNGVRTKEVYYKDTGAIATDSDFKEMRDLVKKHIMNNGGAWCDIRTHNNFIGNNLGDTNYTSRYSQYDDGTIPNEQTSQHAITIIGWDDNYSRDNFKVKDVNGNWVKPIENGAWLIINNTNSSELQGGCQWISYEDYAINAEIFGFVSADTTKKSYNYRFTGQSAYNKLKGFCSEYGNGVDCSDNTKTINGLDLIFNDFKTLNFNSCELSNADLNVLFTYKLPRLTNFSANNNNLSDISGLSKNKDILEIVDLSANKIKDVSVFENMANLKSLNLQGNQISDVSSLRLNKYDSINLKNQVISKTVNNTDICSYPNLFTEAKKSSSKLYSSSGLEFVNCREKADGTGIKVNDLSKAATVKIKSGDAEGSILTINVTGTVDRTGPKLLSLSVVSPNSGSYKYGTEIVISASFDKNIYAKYGNEYDDIMITTAPKLTVKFGNGTARQATYRVSNLKTISYVIKIEDNDNGELTVVNYSGTIYDINENATNLTAKPLTGNKITAIKTQKGDVNLDDNINIRDIIKIRKYMANSTKWELTDRQKMMADVTGDGYINIRDVIKIRKYISAKSNSAIARKHPDWLW